MQLDPTVGKELVDFALLDGADVWIVGVIDVEVVPENDAFVLGHTQHFGSDRLPEVSVQNRCKHGRLQDHIEGVGSELKISGATALHVYAMGQAAPGCGDPVREEIDAVDVFRPGAPLDELSKPGAAPAADFQDPLSVDRHEAIASEPFQEEALALVDPKHKAGVGPRIEGVVFRSPRIGVPDAILLERRRSVFLHAD